MPRQHVARQEQHVLKRHPVRPDIRVGMLHRPVDRHDILRNIRRLADCRDAKDIAVLQRDIRRLNPRQHLAQINRDGALRFVIV